MTSTLAKLHRKYGIFDEFPIDRNDWLPVMIETFREHKDLGYLHSYYVDYFAQYRELPIEISDSGELTGVARTVDLQFIGKNVLKSNKCKYFIVFEGSLADVTEPSMTVLSCLWATEDSNLQADIMKRFWPGKGKSSYDFIVKCLSMTPEVASDVFVTDAVRIANSSGKPALKMNRELLHSEIAILNPEYVVLLGSTAKNVYGKVSPELDYEVVALPFPTKNYRSTEKIQNTLDEYARFRELAE